MIDRKTVYLDEFDKSNPEEHAAYGRYLHGIGVGKSLILRDALWRQLPWWDRALNFWRKDAVLKRRFGFTSCPIIERQPSVWGLPTPSKED